MPAHSKTVKPSTQVAVIGIDIGKNVFHLIGLGRVEERRGNLGHTATSRFPSPLIKPDVPISQAVDLIC